MNVAIRFSLPPPSSSTARHFFPSARSGKSLEEADHERHSTAAEDAVMTESRERPIWADIWSPSGTRRPETGIWPRDAAWRMQHVGVPPRFQFRGRSAAGGSVKLGWSAVMAGRKRTWICFRWLCPVELTPNDRLCRKERHRQAGPRVRQTVSISSFSFWGWAQERFSGSWLRTFMSATSPGASLLTN